jgi:archaellum component FlaF (FlaF/FlaG flagellin family)
MSPVIAIVMLLMITVSLVGLSYVWVSATFKETAEETGKSIERGMGIISTNFVVNSAWASKDKNAIYISLQNTGSSDIKLEDVTVLVNGIDAGKSYADINPEGLVLYLPFDEGSGTTAYDLSGYGNDGTLVNGPVWVDGIFGKALSFDGVDDYVGTRSLTQFFSTVHGPSTLVMWFKPSSTGSIQYLFSDACPEWRILINSDNTVTGCTYACARSNTQVSSNKWYLVALVHEHPTGLTNTKVRLYLNGVLESETTFSITTQNGYVNEYHYIGVAKGYSACVPSVDSYFFNGIIDEVRIYNRALSEEEIKALYGKGILKPGKKAVLKITTPPQITDPCGARVVVKYLSKEAEAEVICTS